MTARPVPLSGGLRMLRGGLVAVSATALAVAAHAAAGGAAPDVGLTVLVCLGLTWVGTSVADRRHHPAAIVAALGGSQLALHAVLTMPHGLAGHHHSLVTSTTVVDGPTMFAAHTAAAVLTGLLLSTADTALLAGVTAIAMALPRTPDLVLAQAPLRVSRRATTRADTTRDLLMSRIHARRGPPVSN